MTKEEIGQILNKSFNVVDCQVIDDSAKHAGHFEAPKSGGSHFSVYIVAEEFSNTTLVKRHRMVYDALNHHMKDNIHALALKTLSPEEV